MHVAALEIELHLADSHSLKQKRSVVRHLVETARRRYGVSASEVAHHDLWQRTGIGFCVVAPSPGGSRRSSTGSSASCGPIPRSRWSRAPRHWLDLDR